MPKNLDMVYRILEEERAIHDKHERKMWNIIVMLICVICILIGLLYCDHININEVVEKYHTQEQENGPSKKN